MRTGILVVTGAVAGWWLFGPPGAALFAGFALAVAMGGRFLGRRAPRVFPAVLLALAAAGFNASSTLGWGGADAPDGTRCKASPVGLSHVLTPDRPVSETVDCGWHAASGYPAACAVAEGGTGAFRLLRAVYPLILAAAVLALLGALLSLAPSALRRARRPLAALGIAAAASAVAVFGHSLPRALADLAGLQPGVGGTLGMMQLVAAGLLSLAVALQPASRTPRR